MKKEIIDYKTEAEHFAASKIVETNLSQFEEERQLAKNKEAAEKEALLAEAYKLTGRVEALKLISDFGNVSSLLLLQNIKEKKIYKNMQGITSWENYCKSIGYSYKTIDDKLQFLNILGSEFLETVSTFGVGYRALKNITSRVKAGNLEVKENEVVIEGETISLDNKDELKDALDTLLKSKYKEIEEKEKEIKEQKEIINNKDNEIERLQESNKTFFQDKQKAETELAKIKGVGSINNIPLDENLDFLNINNIERKVDVLYADLLRVKVTELSDFNKKKLGAVIIKAMNLLHDYHQELCSNGITQYYGDAFIDDDVINADGKLELPSDFLHKNK